MASGLKLVPSRVNAPSAASIAACPAPHAGRPVLLHLVASEPVRPGTVGLSGPAPSATTGSTVVPAGGSCFVGECGDPIDCGSAAPLSGASGGKSAPAARASGGTGAHSGVLVPRVIDYAHLIGRKPYEADHRAVAGVLTGKRVLITGAGGSIGSELVRVACAYEPELVVLMERSENALFEIDRLMREQFPSVARKAVLHDVVDEHGTNQIMQALRPHVVFHAAAHKHVPLMEDHPGHAVTNNLFGTKAIADAALKAGCERFVMISSDKAVNPASVMGATKRLAELYIRHLSTRPEAASTRLSMVRFGNVLGSACSVLTIWGQQLAAGGPLTVTDPRMTRYFMTIPEAATLVIQSAALPPSAATGGKASTRSDQAGVFVLDMGGPIRILDLAARFARAHGLRVRIREESLDAALLPALQEWMWDRRAWLAGHGSGPEVEVVFTGIRPGEKLYEELAYAAELLEPTSHPGVQAWAGEGELGDIPLMLRELDAIRFLGDRSAIVESLRRHVPEMRRSHGDLPADAPASR